MSGALAALLICVAGGIGATLRLILDGLIKARIRSSMHEFFGGSVAAHLAHRQPRPVVVVPVHT